MPSNPSPCPQPTPSNQTGQIFVKTAVSTIKSTTFTIAFIKDFNSPHLKENDAFILLWTYNYGAGKIGSISVEGNPFSHCRIWSTCHSHHSDDNSKVQVKWLVILTLKAEKDRRKITSLPRFLKQVCKKKKKKKKNKKNL